jgi:hypothetical protein
MGSLIPLNITNVKWKNVPLQQGKKKLQFIEFENVSEFFVESWIGAGKEHQLESELQINSHAFLSIIARIASFFVLIFSLCWLYRYKCSLVFYWVCESCIFYNCVQL